MRQYEPKQRVSDKRWDYVCGNRPVGYCTAYREFTEKDTVLTEQMREKENERIRANKEKYHTNGHATEIEARECYKQYLLDNRTRLCPKLQNPSQLNKCVVCGEFCSGFATVGECRYYTLCEKHCNREELEKLVTPPGLMWIS